MYLGAYVLGAYAFRCLCIRCLCQVLMRGGAFVDFREVKAPDKSTFGCLFRVLSSKGAFVAGAFLKIWCSGMLPLEAEILWGPLW